VTGEPQPRVFDPPPPAAPARVPAQRAAIAEDVEAPTEPPPQLLGPTLQVVEAADETAFSCRTIKEDRLLGELFPRPDCTLSMGDALYRAFATVGMRAKRRPLRPSDWFEASRGDLAELLHVQPRTLGPYLSALREVGLLERRRRRRGSNLYRLPHYRAESRKATSFLSSDHGRRPVANQARSGKETSRQPHQENDTAERNVVRLSARDERQTRRARRAAALDSLIEGNG
jgi:DNA-binding transcriptional ArsR family regulator